MPVPTALNRIPAVWVDEKGALTREAYRFLLSLQGNSNEAAAGEVATPSGSGLQGGGAVADGVTLSIAPNGVTNAMIRQGLATSVVGRFQNSQGNVADIQAVQNGTVLGRLGNQLVFTPSPVVQSLETDALQINQTPAASSASVTHSIPIETASGTMYLLLSSTP